MDAALWSFIEVCLGIVSACLPIMTPLLKPFTRMVSLTRHSKKSKGTPNVSAASYGLHGSVSHSSRTTADDVIDKAGWPGYTERQLEHKAELERELNPQPSIPRLHQSTSTQPLTSRYAMASSDGLTRGGVSSEYARELQDIHRLEHADKSRDLEKGLDARI